MFGKNNANLEEINHLKERIKTLKTENEVLKKQIQTKPTTTNDKKDDLKIQIIHSLLSGCANGIDIVRKDTVENTEGTKNITELSYIFLEKNIKFT